MRKRLILIAALITLVAVLWAAPSPADAAVCEEDTTFRLLPHPKWNRAPDVCRPLGPGNYFVKVRRAWTEIDIWVWRHGWLRPTIQSRVAGGPRRDWCWHLPGRGTCRVTYDASRRELIWWGGRAAAFFWRS